MIYTGRGYQDIVEVFFKDNKLEWLNLNDYLLDKEMAKPY